MTFVDCQPASSNPVTELASDHLSSLNQQIYLRLRLALSLNLRRQIFVAVCDDVGLRDRFAAQLRADLANTAHLGIEAANAQVSHPLSPAIGQTSSTTPRLVTLKLNLPNPSVLEQATQWLAQHSSRKDAEWVPTFQVVGVEALTRQPVHIQRAFLNSLQCFANYPSAAEFNLILWVPRPWCWSIQQSVPEFWRLHTGMFEFEGDPAPNLRRSRGAGERSSKKESSTSDLQSSSLEVLPRDRSRAESNLADLVLAAVMQEVDGQPVETHWHQLDPSHPSLEPIRLLQHLEELQLHQAPAASQAAAYRQLGDWYRDRAEQGSASQQNLSITIRAYEQVLRLLEPTSSQVPDVLNDIGNLYWMLSRCSTAANQALLYLEKALKAYHIALSKTNPETRPTTYVMLQSNLGSAYSDRAQRQNPVENLQLAIAAYQESLKYCASKDDALRYAATQNNLGTAHWNLAQHQNPIANLQQAIMFYNEALCQYNPEQEPLPHAMLQNNLGTAYWNLAQCPQGKDPAEQLSATPKDFLLLAIDAYRVALMYRTLDAAPAACAATQNNLGTAYWHLSNQSSVDYEAAEGYLHHAIAAYKEALAVVDHLARASAPHAPVLTFDHFSTHNNLGSAFHQLATNPHANISSAQRLAYLEASLTHHVQALQGWQEKSDFYPTALKCIVQDVKAFHDRGGIQGQTLALSKIPATLIPSVMKQL